MTAIGGGSLVEAIASFKIIKEWCDIKIGYIRWSLLGLPKS